MKKMSSKINKLIHILGHLAICIFFTSCSLDGQFEKNVAASDVLPADQSDDIKRDEEVFDETLPTQGSPVQIY